MDDFDLLLDRRPVSHVLGPHDANGADGLLVGGTREVAQVGDQVYELAFKVAEDLVAVFPHVADTELARFFRVTWLASFTILVITVWVIDLEKGPARALWVLLVVSVVSDVDVQVLEQDG